jgi:hypothetical protein
MRGKEGTPYAPEAPSFFPIYVFIANIHRPYNSFQL